jgi:protein-disulfide isomerase
MKFLTTSAAAALLATLPLVATAETQMSEDRVKELVLETIRENPEIVMEAVSILREREATAQAEAASGTLADRRDVLERDPNAPVLGNPDGDVTVVEFFDYNCPYCKRAADEVAKLLDNDQNVRLVYREWPILSEGSAYAARAALAAREQDKYAEMHEALMSVEGRIGEAEVLAAAEEVGLDIEKMKADMSSEEVEEHISTSMELSSALGINGTPTFIIGDNMVPGFVEESRLAEMVEEARQAE